VRLVKKMIFAMVVGFVVQLGGLFLIHGVWLKPDYLATAAVWRTQQAQVARTWAMLLGTLIYVVAAVLIYVRGREAKPWFGQGVRFGILLALVVVVYSSLTGWVILPLPHLLVAKWIISETLLTVVLGLVIAGICQQTRADK
jgi:archaellum biogenesis protein FlaJ (TadC family)